MAKTIYKYPLKIDDSVDVVMPAGAEILCVQTQTDRFGNGGANIWAVVDPEVKTEVRRFAIRGTGHPFGLENEDTNYLGTFQLHGGALVFHVFEVKGIL